LKKKQLEYLMGSTSKEEERKHVSIIKPVERD
jgi:hypothetical protein